MIFPLNYIVLDKIFKTYRKLPLKLSMDFFFLHCLDAGGNFEEAVYHLVVNFS